VTGQRDFRWKLYYRDQFLVGAVFFSSFAIFALALGLSIFAAAILSLVALVAFICIVERYFKKKVRCPSCESERFIGRQGERRGDVLYECESCNATYLNGRRQRT
jgi:membrane protein implicated in regulation of membrane protease activity